ncbi:MAG: ATP-binding cassette domain-containing protein, partial [Desulfovibrionaceae bacterium]
MAILGASDLCMAFGGPRLLDGVSFQIEEGQRVAIVGRNGEGKSTLLRLLSGDLTPDAGTVTRRPGLRLARLSQKVPETVTGSVGQVAAQGLGALGGVLAEYRALAEGPAGPDALARLAELEHAMEQGGGWEALRGLEVVLSRLGLDPFRRFEELSGGL